MNQREELRKRIRDKLDTTSPQGRILRNVDSWTDKAMEAIDEFIEEDKLSRQFRIGDKVRVTAHNDSEGTLGARPGLVGLVVGYSKGCHEDMVLCEFNSGDWSGGHNGMEDCVDENGEDISNPTKNGWFKNPDTLEKLP